MSQNGRFSWEWDNWMFEDDGMISIDCQPLVYDFGSDMMKLGFSGDDAPRAVFPTIVGRPKNPKILFGMDCKDCFIGDEAYAKRGILNNKQPIPNDRTQVDFVDLVKLIHHCPYNELCVTPEEHPLLFTTFCNMTREYFGKMSEILFETFNHPALYCADSNVLSLFASGRESGCSVDLGGGSCRVSCVYDGHPIQYSKLVLEDRLGKPRKRIGGDLILDLMYKRLEAQNEFCDKKVDSPDGRYYQTTCKREIARDVISKFCYFATDKESVPTFDFSLSEGKGKKTNHYTEFELIDKTKLRVRDERFVIPEIIFQPKLIGYNLTGIHELVNASISQCHPDLQNEMIENIVLCGGTSMIEGISDRLNHELTTIVPRDKVNKIKIATPAERKYSTWIGGSILSSLTTFRPYWVTQKELSERGGGDYKAYFREKCQMGSDLNGEQVSILKEIWNRSTLDIDMEERIEYAFFECYFEDVRQSCGFTLRFRNGNMDSFEEIKFHFKAFLLL